ncbi:MAG: hypothetical protein PHP44_06770 [Kiritimatiellae bacterium]|nr:hypothetical protein [Kiritimatiellia bacterium]
MTSYRFDFSRRLFTAVLFALLLVLSVPSLSRGQSVPIFTASYTNAAQVETDAGQTQYAPNLEPTEYTNAIGPAEVTNASQLYVQFFSDSLGHTNLTDATAATGFNLDGTGFTNLTDEGVRNPPPNPNTNNLYYSAVGNPLDNQVWLKLNYTPGTNGTAVSYFLQLIAVNGNNDLTTNWTATNLTLTVQPAQPLPPRLEVRFYNYSTNAPGQVFILPTAKGLQGGGFSWSNALGANTWTNWMATTTNMTVSLADIGISGSNTLNEPYYAVYTTNFPNAAWFVSYHGGHLSAPTNAAGQWDGTTDLAGPNREQPTASSTNGLWFGSEWNAFELTLDGNPEDVGDTTYINQFSIPMQMRSFTNNAADASAGIYTNRDSSRFYKVGGWTNFDLGRFSNVVTHMLASFSNAVIRNADGTPVMVAGPTSASSGQLAPTRGDPVLTNNAQNAWPAFTTYFETVKAAQPARKAKIKDSISLAGGKTDPTYFFDYDFDLTVTESNALRLEGSMSVTSAPASGGTYYTNAAPLMMEIGGDAGPNDNWASWSIYGAPTPANLTTVQDVCDLATGLPSGLITNMTAYSAYAENGLGGTPVVLSGSHFLGAAQVAFCAEDNSIIPAPYTVHSDTNLTTWVPYGAVSGPIIVTTLNGSGKSATDFTVTGTAIQVGPAVTPSGESPVITSFAPSSGAPAQPVLTISGDWMSIAQGTLTGPAGGAPTHIDLYRSAFGSAVMGRISGDLAAGFALGFINSSVINPAYSNQPYGESPSGSWWGGDLYPKANTNRLAYSDVNTNASLWGSLIYSGTKVTYGHPIYDRMKIYGEASTIEVIQPPVAINGTPNIWMVEIDFYSGMASVVTQGEHDFYTLIYRAGAGGLISGVATQTVASGAGGTQIDAAGVDTSAFFHCWSDGSRQNPRTETNVQANATLYAFFRSRGGADLDWYAGYGYSTGMVGITEWSDLDALVITNKSSTLLQECIADTDPADTGDVFRTTGISAHPPATIRFAPASTGRLYALEYAVDLNTDHWTNLPGASPRPGTGGENAMQDTNVWTNAFYRVNAEMTP